MFSEVETSYFHSVGFFDFVQNYMEEEFLDSPILKVGLYTIFHF